MSDPQVLRKPVARITGSTLERIEDAVAVEGALEMRIAGRTLAVTLRTPGHDEELASGFLAGEGLIRSRADVASIRTLPAGCAEEADAVDVTLAAGVPLDWSRLERHFAATSACGLCGRAHLDSLRAGLTPIPPGEPVQAPVLEDLPGRLLHSQVTFTATGGLHAAAFCSGP